jgi:hypothetical protein
MSEIIRLPIEKSVIIQDGFKTVVKDSSYKVSGEYLIVVKDVKLCELTLDSTTTKQIKIKSMADTLVKGDYSIDDEYDEIFLSSGASIELCFIENGWYITASDGLKNS